MFYTKCNVIHGVNVTVAITIRDQHIFGYMIQPYWCVHAHVVRDRLCNRLGHLYVSFISIIKSFVR